MVNARTQDLGPVMPPQRQLEAFRVTLYSFQGPPDYIQWYSGSIKICSSNLGPCVYSWLLSYLLGSQNYIFKVLNKQKTLGPSTFYLVSENNLEALPDLEVRSSPPFLLRYPETLPGCKEKSPSWEASEGAFVRNESCRLRPHTHFLIVESLNGLATETPIIS